MRFSGITPFLKGITTFAASRRLPSLEPFLHICSTVFKKGSKHVGFRSVAQNQFVDDVAVSQYRGTLGICQQALTSSDSYIYSSLTSRRVLIYSTLFNFTLLKGAPRLKH